MNRKVREPTCLVDSVGGTVKESYEDACDKYKQSLTKRIVRSTDSRVVGEVRMGGCGTAGGGNSRHFPPTNPPRPSHSEPPRTPLKGF